MFTFDQRRNWKSVRSDSVVRIANECSEGVDFQGSSKSSIYEFFSEKESRMSIKVYPRIFAATMDLAAKIERHHDKQRRDAISQVVMQAKSAKKELRMDKKPQKQTIGCYHCAPNPSPKCDYCKGTGELTV